MAQEPTCKSFGGNPDRISNAPAGTPVFSASISKKAAVGMSCATPVHV